MASLSIPSSPTPAFTPSLLHESYVQRHHDNPLKMKVLHIQEFDTSNPCHKKSLQNVLKVWQDLSRNHASSCYIEMRSLRKDSEHYAGLDLESKVFEDSKHILLRMQQALRYTHPQVTAVLDQENDVQALSYSHPDQRHARTWKIEYLATSPLNIRGTRNQSPQVEGAGTLLIETAIAKAGDNQTLSDLKARTIMLQAFGEAESFYDKLHFQFCQPSADDLSNRILTGDHLIQFLTEYGGRVPSLWNQAMHRAA